MSLTPKRTMTEENLRAHRANGSRSQGAVTPAGKAYAAAAHLRHGRFAHGENAALLALGEDPKDYARLLKSLANDLQPAPGLQEELLHPMARTIWRMRRAQRWEDHTTLKRLNQRTQMAMVIHGPQVLQIQELYEHLTALGRNLHHADYYPSPAEVQEFETRFRNESPDCIQKLLPLLRSFAAVAAEEEDPAGENSNGAPASETERQDPGTARAELGSALDDACFYYRRALDTAMAESDQIQSTEALGAVVAPGDENFMAAQKSEEANLRQLWRLTRMFLRLKGASQQGEEG